MNNKLLFFLGISGLFVGCIAPREITNSGKVTPKGNVVAYGTQTYNFSSIPFQKVAGLTGIDISQMNVVTSDTLSAEQQNAAIANWSKVGEAAIANSVDPVGAGINFGMRYGIANRFDIGYKRAPHANVVDVQYQFLGSIGNVGDDFAASSKWYGSVGLQYSSQEVNLPKWAGPIANRLGFGLGRKDILVPLTFSRSLGNEETFGALSFGVVYGRSNIEYHSNSSVYGTFTNLSGQVVVANLNALDRNVSFNTFGFFASAKLGYKYIYIVPAFALYYQNYGVYGNVVGNDFGMKGITLVPSIGVRLRLGKNSVK